MKASTAADDVKRLQLGGPLPPVGRRWICLVRDGQSF